MSQNYETFRDESENPPATNDPSDDIVEQFNLKKFGTMISNKPDKTVENTQPDKNTRPSKMLTHYVY